MRRAFVLCALLLLPFVPTASASAIEAPGYGMGDEWSYEVTVVDGGAVVEKTERRFVVVARGPVQYQGAMRQAVTVAQHENATIGAQTYASSSETAYDAATGAFLYTRAGEHETLAQQPCLEIEYPVEFGDSWTVNCQFNDVSSETFYSAVGGERLVVPAGPYDTLTIDKIGDHTGRVWISADTCGRPVAEFYQINDRATYVNLTSASCLKTSVDTPTPATPTPAPTSAPTTTPASTTSKPTPTPTGTAASLALPTFTDRDNWHWESTGSFGGASFRVNTTALVYAGSGSARFQGNVNVTATNGTTMLAYLVESSVNTTTGAVRSEKVSPYIGRELFLAGGFSTFGERRYDTPCSFVAWPLVPGKMWSFACSGNVINVTPGGADTPFTVEGGGSVLPVREITTPAGTFTGFPVQLKYTYSDGFSRTQTRVYAADACAYVQMTPGPWGGVDDLVGYYCDATKKGDLVPEEIPERPTPGAATWTLLAVVGVAAFTLRRKRS